MKMEEIRNIGVLGSGIMGHGIAQSFLMGGYPVMLYDIGESILATARSHIKTNLERFCRSGLLKEEEIPICLQQAFHHHGLEGSGCRNGLYRGSGP